MVKLNSITILNNENKIKKLELELENVNKENALKIKKLKEQLGKNEKYSDSIEEK